MAISSSSFDSARSSSSSVASSAGQAAKQGIAAQQAVSKAQTELMNVFLFTKFLKSAEDGAQSAL